MCVWRGRFEGVLDGLYEEWGGLVCKSRVVDVCVWCFLVWYGIVWCGRRCECVVWYCMIWYGVVWYGMVWYGMVWYGRVWYGMVWYGVVWYGMVWYGITLSYSPIQPSHSPPYDAFEVFGTALLHKKIQAL